MPGPPAPVARVRHALRTFLAAQLSAGRAAPGDLVLVACSGGADSLALAAATAFVAPRLGLRAGAVHVDHALQPGSDQVAAQAVAACRALGLEPSLAVRPTTAPPAALDQGGPEARARHLRYTALEATRQQQRACAVVLGHTLDDQAETVLLALARGSGTRAVAGMAPVRGHLWRPLLGTTRAETEAICATAGLPVWHDPTNAIDGPWRTAAGSPLPRSAVRHRVLPGLIEALGPGVRAALARTADLARDDADLLDELAEQAYHRVVAEPAEPTAPPGHHTTPPGPPAAITLDVVALAAEPPALRRRVLHRAALAAGSPAGALAAVHVASLDTLVSDWHGQGPLHLPGALEAVRQCGRLVLRAAPSSRTGGGRPDPTIDQEN